MDSEFNKLAEEIIFRVGDKQIFYLPNQGNFGDALIRQATLCFFRDHGIQINEVNVGYSWGRLCLLPLLMRAKLKGDMFFIYGGGGAWHPGCDLAFKVVKLISNFTDEFLVLPSTFDLDLSSMPEENFFQRDQRVLNFKFCHDMAFYLSGKFNSEEDPLFQKGFFYRTDNESRNSCNELPRSNVDLSVLGGHMSSAGDFLSMIGSCREVYTDRLHVAIGAIIAGVDWVYLSPGSYFKITEIYKSSMAGIFDNVVYQESLTSEIELSGDIFEMEEYLNTIGYLYP